MNRSTLAKLAALVLLGTAAGVTTAFVVGDGGHHDDPAAEVRVGRPSPSHGHPTPTTRHTTPTTHPPAPPAHAFTLTGDVAGLFPGGTRNLQVRITNPTNTAMRVTTVTVTVHDASVACRAPNLVADSYTGKAYVGRHGATSVTIPVRMVRTAPNACQNATFPLVFRAEAVKA
ncbi:MAG TPA: hypothetical protein VIB48_13965 [Acidimicrobiia bacterium]